LPAWDNYYAKTANLPTSARTSRFLDKIPHGGRILDFGAGNGRWSAAFLRDRSDVIIDVLDQNADLATLLPPHWRGEKINTSFQTFTSSKSYDGIWAYASLFFLNKDELKACLHKLVLSLNTGGILFFTMVDECDAATSARFYGLSRESLLEILHHEGLSIMSLTLHEETTYGKNQTIIPTYHVMTYKPE
jgi:trans-aconitate methyltransferase